MLCDHANETPSRACTCSPTCACRQGMCPPLKNKCVDCGQLTKPGTHFVVRTKQYSVPAGVTLWECTVCKNQHCSDEEKRLLDEVVRAFEEPEYNKTADLLGEAGTEDLAKAIFWSQQTAFQGDREFRIEGLPWDRDPELELCEHERDDLRYWAISLVAFLRRPENEDQKQNLIDALRAPE